MKKRRFLAVLLTLGITLTMGGMTSLAADEEDNGTDVPGIMKVVGEDEEDGDIEEEFPDTDSEDTDIEDTDSEEKETPGIIVTEFPSKPVKAGDTVSYKVQIDPKGADMTGWFVVVEDLLKSEIDGDELQEEPIIAELKDKTAEITYQIPKDHFLSEDSYVVNIILTDGEDEILGGYHYLAYDISHEIPAEPTLKSTVDFQVKGLVTNKEYPFTVTWTNTTDTAIDDFATGVWCESCDDAYVKGARVTLKATEYPEGAAVKSEPGSLMVEKMSVPAGGKVSISGTVLFPAKSDGTQLHFREIIDGKELGGASTAGFIVAEANAGGEDTPGNQPGESGEKVLKDKATGITVSGVKEGVELKVKAITDKEQKEAIEEKVKKLVSNNKGIKIFDISLWKDNVEIQPGVPVKVTIPVPEGFSNNLRLYHQNSKGELEKVDITVKNSVVSFEAKNFSPYVLVDLGEGASGIQKETTQKTAPKTADTSSVMLYFILALAAVGCMGAITWKKQNN